MERDVEVLAQLIEDGVDGGAVGLEGEAGRHGLLDAARVVELGVGRDDELVARLEGGVADDGWVPDGEAGWVAVPFLVGDGGVTDW